MPRKTLGMPHILSSNLQQNSGCNLLESFISTDMQQAKWEGVLFENNGDVGGSSDYGNNASNHLFLIIEETSCAQKF